MALTDTHIRTAKPSQKAYKLVDGHGLFLLVKPNGSRLWRYRYRIGGKENLFAIGEYPGVSLKTARDERSRARELVKQGVHPSRQRRLDKIVAIGEAGNTFEAVALEWMNQHANWTSAYRKQVEASFKAYVFSKIGSMPIKGVGAAHLLQILKRIAEKGVSGRPAPNVAILVRQWCSSIFLYAMATLRADSDPTVALKGAIKKPRTKHKTALNDKDFAEFFRRIDDGGTPQVQIALKLIFLTFVRPVELREASWSEFDFKKGLWRIPKERMKMREEHVVPLSKQALSLLAELKRITGSNHLLFPNVRDSKRAMSQTTMNRRLERLGYGGRLSAHAFRATASTALNERGWHADVIERQLAHAERNAVRASYNHAEYMDDRREMMQDWANYIDSQTGKSKLKRKAAR